MAAEKGIAFRIIDNSDGISIWADKDKVEKILFNLLANAFKFTPEGKTIEVAVTHNEQSVSVRVQDEGMGMPPDKLSHLFVRYDSTTSYDGFQAGTGIGLSLTKELCDMHHATIIADSRVGYGTWFTVTFLLGTKHYGPEADFIVDDQSTPQPASSAPASGEAASTEASSTETASTETSSTEAPTTGEADGGNPEALPLGGTATATDTILIIEDNEELRAFLRTVLSRRFVVAEAADGEEGLRKALDIVPDIIITDVMMPKMDGLELVDALKANVRTSHIPIILLTARTAMEDKLAALDRGADDYITKPFSAEYLDARIQNLLQQRKTLQEAYRAAVEAAKPEAASQDDIFIANLVRLLEENMENSELTVDDLVHMAGLSRSVFFKKLKSLTGLAPIEFIREMRIKRAAQLIETREYNISQVAYMVGMNDPRYFSRCFKQKYGMTPTEYKQAAEIKKN
jgi:DNA-binding response OmpR family regulator